MSAFGNVLSTKVSLCISKVTVKPSDNVPLCWPQVMRDPDTGEHRGFGFVAFDAFESSDAALAAMNGQFLCDRPIHVSYAYKKDTKGEVLVQRLACVVSTLEAEGSKCYDFF